MEHWVRLRFDFSGDHNKNHTQEVKTDDYYRDNDDGSILHVQLRSCINFLDNHSTQHVLKKIPEEEFEKILKETIDYMGINITQHKFIKNAKK